MKYMVRFVSLDINTKTDTVKLFQNCFIPKTIKMCARRMLVYSLSYPQYSIILESALSDFVTSVREAFQSKKQQNLGISPNW